MPRPVTSAISHLVGRRCPVLTDDPSPADPISHSRRQFAASAFPTSPSDTVISRSQPGVHRPPDFEFNAPHMTAARGWNAQVCRCMFHVCSWMFHVKHPATDLARFSTIRNTGHGNVARFPSTRPSEYKTALTRWSLCPSTEYVDFLPPRRPRARTDSSDAGSIETSVRLGTCVGSQQPHAAACTGLSANHAPVAGATSCRTGVSTTTQ